MRNEQNGTNQVVETGVAAIATASKTPFKTAFKIMFGIALAQLTIGILFLLGTVVVIAGLVLLFK